MMTDDDEDDDCGEPFPDDLTVLPLYPVLRPLPRGERDEREAAELDKDPRQRVRDDDLPF